MLGSVEGEVVVIGADLAAVACDLLDRLLSAGGELVTLVVGPDAGAWATRSRRHLPDGAPDGRGPGYAGGPDDVPLLVGVE